eukprot:m.61849 g.61849  ORF g.61849 m.61849 type:complete len:73 (-) comp12365_c2_seq1:5765-5983(-)
MLGVRLLFAYHLDEGKDSDDSFFHLLSFLQSASTKKSGWPKRTSQPPSLIPTCRKKTFLALDFDYSQRYQSF